MQHFETVCCIDKEVIVLKLTIKPGEFINIGDDVIDAPRELNIVRSKVLARNSANSSDSDKKTSRFISPYYAEQGLSPETLNKIRRLIKEDKQARKSNDNTQG